MTKTIGKLHSTLRSGPVLVAVLIIITISLMAIFAPWIAPYSPEAINPSNRLSLPGSEHWFGTDGFGRDVFSRVVYGARVSLVVGIGAAAIGAFVGLVIGLFAGYFSWIDAIVMRIMDGVMAIPGVLLAIALVALSGASLMTVMIAIVIPEIPRVVRLMRSIVLSVKTEPFVEAAMSQGTPVIKLLWRHLVPSTIPPLIIQGVYIFASAILTEAILSFLGVGLPPETSSWGNVMADGRMYFQIRPGLILYAGFFLSLTVLSVNVIGDGLRDALDPRLRKGG